MTLATTRPAPPPIEARGPDCPICGDETQFVDDSFECEDCFCHWPDGFDEPGKWIEDDATQCPSTHQPYAGNRYVTDPAVRAAVYRCVLDDGHDGNHRHPDLVLGWADGHRDEAATPRPIVDVQLPGDNR